MVAAVLPFDAHNHIHLGPIPSPPLPSSTWTTAARRSSTTHKCAEGTPPPQQRLRHYVRHALPEVVSGLALMATHPRDFQPLLDLHREILDTRYTSNHHNTADGSDTGTSFHVLPCLGVHPWFLHELEPEDWELIPAPSFSSSSARHPLQLEPNRIPKWVAQLEVLLVSHPQVPCVGEIGLDQFHFNPTTNELTTTMAQQKLAFRYQLQLATMYNRAVSVHCVQAVGSLMEVLHEVSTHNLQIQQQYDEYEENEDEPPPPHSRVLPPRIYFHAFGGKAATAIQLIRTLEKIKPNKKKRRPGRQQPKPPRPTTKVYFGFAPIVNFQTKTQAKTLDVIRTIGIQRLVLETDHDDVTQIQASLDQGVDLIAAALQMAPEDVIRRTNRNVRELYNLTTAL